MSLLGYRPDEHRLMANQTRLMAVCNHDDGLDGAVRYAFARSPSTTTGYQRQRAKRRVTLRAVNFESDPGYLSLDAEESIPEEPVGIPARSDLCS